MFCLYQNFMFLWVGKDLTLSALISLLFVLYFGVLKIGDIRSTYSVAAGLWWENRHRAIIKVIVYIALNYLFVRLWGVYGIIIATIIPILTINNTVGMRILNTHYFENEHGTILFFWKNLLYLLATFIAGVVTWQICRFTPGGMAGLFIKGIICVFVPNMIYLLLYRKYGDYMNAKKWVLARIKR